jgi:hypothetical protein
MEIASWTPAIKVGPFDEAWSEVGHIDLNSSIIAIGIIRFRMG